MTRALGLLLLLRANGALRRVRHLLRNPRQAWIPVLAALLLVVACSSAYLAGTHMGPDAFPELLAILLPAFVLLLFLSRTYRPGAFAGCSLSKAEIELLLAGPVSWRQLFLYKHVDGLVAILAVSLFLGTLLRGDLGGLDRAFLFSALVLLIAHSIALAFHAITTASAHLSRRLPELLRWVPPGAGIFWCAELLITVRHAGRFGFFDVDHAQRLVESLRDTSFGAIALFPFEPVRLMAEAEAASWCIFFSMDWPSFAPERSPPPRTSLRFFSEMRHQQRP